MCIDIITCLTIGLSVLSILIGLASLVFAIIYLIKIIKVEKTQEKIKKTLQILDVVKESLIQQAVHFGPNGMISGKEIIKKIQEQHNCSDWEALKILHTKDSLTLK